MGQSIQKSSLIEFHIVSITLESEVTMEQYLDFYLNNYIPEFEKVFPGIQLFIIQCVSGKNENKFGLLYHYESMAYREKLINEDDSVTDFGYRIRS